MVDARVIPWALAATTLLVFSPALLNGFVEWDDHVNLIQNTGYRGLGWRQLRWMFTTIVMGHYIPVTWLTFGLDYTLWGMNPLGYHLTNNLLHAANSAIFYLLALRLLARATSLAGPALRVASVMAALFFALHPLRAESVAWATERRDVLSGLFFLLTVSHVSEGGRGHGPATAAAARRVPGLLRARPPLQVDRDDAAAHSRPPGLLSTRATPVPLGNVEGVVRPDSPDGEAALSRSRAGRGSDLLLRGSRRAIS